MEATIAQIQRAMAAGALSSVELTALYLNRVFAYDRNGIKLNAIPVLNPAALDEAAAADRLRAEGKVLGPLHGIPFTVKDSYKAKGLTVAAGSPAFANLIARDDAFTVGVLRAAGGILIGKTNMPAMAHGGMQRGVYGRAESPYNGDYLTAAWTSGSSNGSGTATAASFAAFGMGEETVSSGRSPASNNGLVAYTPSRGLISIRGNWPLYPLRDVVVPMTRTLDDLFALLDVIVAEDPVRDGDFWRSQTIVTLPSIAEVRPKSYAQLADRAALKGKRFGVPKIYIGESYGDGRRLDIRPSIRALWDKAAADLAALGAELVEVEFPALYNWEKDQPPQEFKPVARSHGAVARGLFPAEWLGRDGIENQYFTPYLAEEFLRGVGDPNYPSWTAVNADDVFPFPPGEDTTQRYRYNRDVFPRLIESIAAGVKPVESLPRFAEAVRGLETVRKVDFEDWLDANNLDGMVFPANLDIGRADADVDDASFAAATRYGVLFSNGNRLLRCLGIPSVSVCMGLMADTNMPVNLTFIGPAYQDNDLLRFAYAYEQATRHRRAPGRVPPLAHETIGGAAVPPAQRSHRDPPRLTLAARLVQPHGKLVGTLELSGEAVAADGTVDLRLTVNGQPARLHREGAAWNAAVPLAQFIRYGAGAVHSLAVLILAKDSSGNTAARLQHVSLPPV